MTSASTNPRRKWLYVAAVAGLFLIAASFAAVWYLSSPSFNTWLRARVISTLEQATGGRVELGELNWKLSGLSIEARDLTIHGLESANDQPYVHVDRAFLQAKIMSVFRRQIGLRSFELDQPAVHIIVYPDGSTNQPAPKLARSNGATLQKIVDLQSDSAIVKDGRFVLNAHPVPVDFDASDVAVSLGYTPSTKSYDGTIHAGRIVTKLSGLRPIAAIADAEFTVSASSAQLKSLQVSSGGSRFEVSGSLHDFAQPAVAFTYRGALRLADVGAILRKAQLRGGLLKIDGNGAYEASSYHSSGKIAADGVEWKEPSFRIRKASVGADFNLDRDRLEIPRLSIRALGGVATGSAEVVDWLSPTGNRAAASSAKQRGAVHLRVAGMSLSAIATAASKKSLPLDRLKLAGITGGTISTSWTGPIDNAVTQLALAVSAPASAGADELPTTADLSGVYTARSQTLQISKLNVTTPATRIQASGMLGGRTSSLDVTASTANLGEWKPFFAAEGKPSQWPIDVRGQAAFNGSASGKLSAPSIAGHLRVADFDSILAPFSTGSGTQLPSAPSSAPQPSTARRMHWDSFTANLRYSPAALSLKQAVLRRGRAQVNFDFSADLDRGRFTDQSQFTAAVNIRNGDLADLQTLAGYDYPVTGTVQLSANVSGTQADPHGGGDLQITNAVVYGQSVSRLSSKISFAKGQLQLTDVQAAQNHAEVTGMVAYAPSSRTFRFNLRGTDFNLADVRGTFQEKFHPAGKMKFTADGSGTLEQPSIDADVSLTNVVLNGERVGDMNLQARTTGDTMKVFARADISDSELTVEGNIRLRENYPATLAVRLKHVDLDPLIRAYMKGRLTGHSHFEGKIDINGPLRDFRNVGVTGEVSQFYVPVENINIRNEGPIRFSLARQVLSLQQLHLVAEDTDLSATGTAELAENKRLDLAANGHVNLKIIQSLSPDYTSYGQLAMNVRVRGTIANPRLNGEVQISNGGISYIDLPNGLSDANGKLFFNNDRLQISQLTARTGGGTVNMTGYVTYARTLGFNIQAKANDIRLRYPPGVSAMADANVRLTGTLQNSLLSGDVTITRFGLNPRFDFAQYLARSRQPENVVNPKSPMNNVRLDLHVTSTPELQVQTSLAKLSGDVDMRLRGTALRPSALGRVVIVEGDIFFNGTKYHLERGDVTFTNPTRIQPIVDVEASTRVRDYDITLGFHGPTEKLSTTYRSDPPLATADIIALLAFGRTREESALQPVSNQNFTETASNAILGQALNATVSSRVQKLFGVSRIKIDPQVGGAENNPSTARVTIEQQVANNLTVTYITDLARSNQQVISVEYNVSRAVSLVAVRDQYGVVSFDVRIRQRKR